MEATESIESPRSFLDHEEQFDTVAEFLECLQVYKAEAKATQEPLGLKMVSVQPVCYSIFNGRGKPETITRAVQATFNSDKTSLSYYRQVSHQPEVPCSLMAQDAGEHQAEACAKLKAELEDSLLSVGLAMPITVGTSIRLQVVREYKSFD